MMTDLVRILETYCLLNSIEFRYGSESHLNLLNGDIDKEQIYLLLFPIKRASIQTKNSTKVQGQRYTGRFMLLKGSDYATHYFNENGTDPTDSKYTLNVEPLLEVGISINEYLMCKDLEVERYECDDAINVLDANKDGIWCNFSYVYRR